jgi:hypothetical protein
LCVGDWAGTAQAGAARARVHRAVADNARWERELEDLRIAAIDARQRVEVATKRLTETEQTVRDKQAEADQVAEAPRVKAKQVAESSAGPKLNGPRGHGRRKLDRRWQAHADHQALRPGLWRQLTTFGGAGRQWSHQDRRLAQEVAVAEQSLAAARDFRIDEMPDPRTPYPPL